MRKSSFCFLLFVLLLALCVMGSGGCGGSSNDDSSGSDNRSQFINAVGDVVDGLQDIADSALSNRKVITAIDDIIGQYVVLSSTDSTLQNRAIGRTLMANDVISGDWAGNPSFDKVAYVPIWSNKHIGVENNVVTAFETGQSDFQLTVTSRDNHVTKLTITPASTSGYWQAFPGASALLEALATEERKAVLGEHRYLVCAYTYASANIKVEYDGTTLMDGTISVNYPGKTTTLPGNTGALVFANTPHTTKFALTLYPQDNKDYSVGIDLTNEVISSGANSIRNVADLALYRKTGSTTRTILDVSAGMDATVPSGSTRPSAAVLKPFDLNIAGKIRLAESGSLDLVKLMGLYVTGGANVSEETVKSNAEKINTLFSDAGLSLYLNGSTTKAGDVRALAGNMGGYNHVRYGIQFVGADKPELVRNIANPEDMAQLKTLIGSVSTQARLLAQLLTSTGLLGNVTDNEIIRLVFEDLFGNA